MHEQDHDRAITEMNEPKYCEDCKWAKVYEGTDTGTCYHPKAQRTNNITRVIQFVCCPNMRRAKGGAWDTEDRCFPEAVLFESKTTPTRIPRWKKFLGLK
jgi:hypothetical protein